MALGNPLEMRVVVNDAEVLAALRSGRREMNQHVKRALFEAGTELAVPAVRALAPFRSGELRAAVEARATTRGVYLTTRLAGKRGRYVGLMNYGGTIRGEIAPRGRGPSPLNASHARALRVGDGYVRRVTTPRKYERRLFYERGRDAALPAIEEVLADRVVAALAGGVRAVLVE
jgi:hypothetical protein